MPAPTIVVAAALAFARHPILPPRTPTVRPLDKRVSIATSVKLGGASLSTERPRDFRQLFTPPPLRRPRLRWLLTAFALASLAVPRALRAATASVAPALPQSKIGWLTIPLVAGLLNWATNQLAVKMMFYPLKFRGYRRVGWQGIVPNKAKVMANRIVDDVVLRLIDLRVVFARLPPEEIANALEPLVVEVGGGLARDLLERKGLSALARPTVAALNDVIRTRGAELVASFVRDVQAEPEAVFDLRQVVVRGFASDPKVLVDLFERVGEQDLRFVVNSGLFLGGALGVLQALLWAIWSPWWSLALTGAAVGMVTDQLALNLIFLPVEPRRIGPFTLQGLFLRRQAQVSAEFSEFVVDNVLTAEQYALSHALSSSCTELLADVIASCLTGCGRSCSLARTGWTRTGGA